MAITFPEFTYLTLQAAPKWGSTTCCWFKLPATIYEGGGVGLISFGTANTYGTCVVTQTVVTGEQYTLRVLDSSFRDIGCSYIKPDTWYFLALSITSSGVATCYVGMAGRAGILSAFDSFQTTSETGQRVFGALGDGSYSDYGSVCWIKAWSAELTKSELIAEMSGSALVRTANAFACCPLLNHTTLTDTSGQGHPISMVNGGAASTIADVEPVTTVTLPTLTTNLAVACVGDSRTFGTNGGGTTWPGTLQTLRTGDTIVNDGVSGMGAGGDYLRIQETVLPRWTSGGGTNVRACLIQNGINDIANGVSLNRILGNMLSSIDLLLTHGSLVYPVFLSELADGVSSYNTIEQQLSTELASICTTLGIKFVDFRTNSDLMNPVSSAYGGAGGDGRHLVATGYALMGNLVDAAMDSWYSSGPIGTSELPAIASSGTASVEIIVSGAGASALSAVSSTGVGSRSSFGVTEITSGAVSVTAASATSVSPAIPSGSVGDLIVVSVAMKPASANGGTCTTPAGYTAPSGGSITGAGGYSTTLAGDTGNTNIWTFYRAADGSEGSSVAITIGTNNVAWAKCHRLTCGSKTWAVAATNGSDTSAGNVSITLAADPGVKAGDILLATLCIPTDAASFSGEAFAQTGVTFGPVTESAETASGTGNDIGGITCYATVESGTSSAAPVFTATAGGTTTNVRGPLVLLRIRDAGFASIGQGSLPVIASSGSGSVGITGVSGSGSSSVAPVNSSGVGSESYASNGSSTLSGATSSGSATLTITSSGGSLVASIAGSGTANQSLSISGNGTSALAVLASSGSGTEAYTGSGSSTVSSFSSAGIGNQALGVSGSGSSSITSITSLGAATEAYYGSGASSLYPFTSFGAGATINGVIGYGGSVLVAIVSSGSGSESYTGSGSSALPSTASTGNATALLPITSSGASLIVAIASSGAATETHLGGGSSTLSSLASSGNGLESYLGYGGSSLSNVASSGLGNFVQLAITGSGESAIHTIGSAGFGFIGLIATSGNSTRYFPETHIMRTFPVSGTTRFFNE